MTVNFPPINPRFPHFLHGGDYNPDQWNEEIWSEDMRLMKLANCNTMSVAIFAWTRIEPEEGKFDFSWLDKIMDMLAANGGYAVLATPSGARPAWLSAKYPEILRVHADRQRILHGGRHNHCMSSPVYREKVQVVNHKMAERYKDHPALLVWHISNEYGGECHCELCQRSFRSWLKVKYNNDLTALNQAWWSAFWSHTYTDWEQIESPSPIGEMTLHGLNLDWKRYTTDQMIDFYNCEIQPLRELTPDTPITTNFMGLYTGINYPRFAKVVDVVSWDNYPVWHTTDADWKLATQISFVHDQNRSMKGGKPFMLMESTPSNTNWQPIPKLKRPGMHKLSSLQAVAHGSDTVQYFQWRKSRGSAEKFHGAVVDHVGHEHTRVFRDVAELGDVLKKLDPVVGTTVRPEVAIIYDWENRWAIDDLHGLGRDRRNYAETCINHYQPFWSRGIPVDVIPEWADFASYKLVVAPMLYMLQPGVAERLKQFVAGGGTLVCTYWSGIVDENDLCFLGGWPGNGLREVFGIWDEEIDTVTPADRNQVVMADGNPLGLSGAYEARDYFSLIHAEGARVLAAYAADFYAGRPALTVNAYGKGKAYYMASRNDERFLNDFYASLAADLDLLRALPAALPEGVTAQLRTDGDKKFIFVMNFNPDPAVVDLAGGSYQSMMSGSALSGKVELPGYGIEILQG
ncbi:MAG: beta-galactosidase [Anaerolineaceae bacterium]|nr:beta-galactosidase [Anaerolineaceae bacterium]